METNDTNKVKTLFKMLNSCLHNIFFYSREFLDSKTYLGIYVSSITSAVGGLTYFFFTVISIGLFTGLSAYINASFEDFEKTFSKLNNEIIREPEKSSKSQKKRIDLDSTFKEIIILHNDMQKYMRLFCDCSKLA